MPVPFGSLVPARSRVLPQTGQVLGRLAGGFTAGLEQGRERAATDAAPDLLLNYLDTQGRGFGGGTLGNLGAASGYVAGQPAPTQPNQPMVPGSPTFDGRTAMRQARQDADSGDPAGAAPYRHNDPPERVAWFREHGYELTSDYRWTKVREDGAAAPTASPDYAATLAGYGSGLNTTNIDPAFGTGLNTAIQAYVAAGGNPADVQINSLVRSTDEQARLYDQYQRGEIGLAAPPGQSRHEYGAAADIQSGPFLDWLHQNAGQFGLSFLSGNAFVNDPGHVQLAGPSPAGTRAPAIPAGSGGAAAPAGGGYQSAPAWSPPTGAERAQLRALMINPATREMGYQLAIQRMTPPAPVTPNYGFQEVNGVLYRTDPTTGQAVPVSQAGAPQPDYGFTNVPGVGLVRTDSTSGTAQPLIATPAGGGEQPTDIQVYDYYVSQERAAGREPKSFNDWDLERRGRLGGIDPTVAEQRYALLYQNAARELPTIEQTFSALSVPGNQAAALLPDLISNFIVSPEYQRALSAMTQIVQMQTYALTGAAATESEANRIARTLLPAIGDGPEVIADKLARTRAAVESIRGAAGPAGQVPTAAPTPAPPAATTTPLAPGAPVDPAVIWQWDPATNTLVPVN